MARVPLAYHIPSPDSQLYSAAGIVGHPLQRNIFPSPWSLLKFRNWGGAFRSIFPQILPVQPHLNPIKVHDVNHSVPNV